MRTLTWAARGVAAVSGVVLAGTLLVPAASAYQGPEPKAPVTEPAAVEQSVDGKCQTSRDVSSTVVDFVASGLFETVFRSATDNQGHAFLNDSRNPGVWINLALVPGAPRCVYDTSVAVTEENPGHLFITLLASDGTLHQATCATTSGAPFTPSNLPTACAPGFAALPDTPV
ncbi:hypothetical protein ABZZ17_19950 [Streptomyces sp. NPDC006512]|uniref:hypothetical protein n=1 Tax=Streptomyces sp. NPDC006512 TaxID=3154307 RepID=UPI0033B8FAEA